MQQYKILAANLHLQVRWGVNQIFPLYRDVSGSRVSTKRLSRAKQVVIQILREEEEVILKAFKVRARKKYKGKIVAVKLDIELAISKVQRAKLKPDGDEWGESAYDAVWVSKTKMSDELLVSLGFVLKFNFLDFFLLTFWMSRWACCFTRLYTLLQRTTTRKFANETSTL
jgi:hypothetical protein